MKGASVAILENRHLPFHGTEALALNFGCKLVSADFSCTNPYPFRFITAYRRPGRSDQETREFFDCFSDWCSVVYASVIVCDFNIPLSQTKSQDVNMLNNFLAECGLVGLIDGPTRKNSFLLSTDPH